MDELFTNIISYGFDDEEEHLIEITIDRSPTGRFRIEDDGVPFNPVEASRLKSDARSKTAASAASAFT